MMRFIIASQTPMEWVQFAGWLLMVIGFILVLYSRLYLVIISPQIRRVLLPIILIIILGTNLLVYTLICLKNQMMFLRKWDHQSMAYLLAWKLQLIAPAQEIVLASLYVFFFIHFLRNSSANSQLKKKNFSSLMYRTGHYRYFRCWNNIHNIPQADPCQDSYLPNHLRNQIGVRVYDLESSD
jgi:hypothetical protein